MGNSPLFPAQHRVRCPTCGSHKLHLRTEPDPIDRVVQTPADFVKRLVIANMQLYHCRVCRLQFYDVGPSDTAPATAAPPAATPVPQAPKAPRKTGPAMAAPSPEASLVGQHVTIHGRIWSAENVLVDGEIVGDIDLPAHRLTIGAAGRIHGDVRAAEALVAGAMQGNVEAIARIAVLAGARVTGSLRAPSIAIAEGAFVQGKIETA